jgi:RimJ/RimL family protein N-acetyltransferase
MTTYKNYWRGERISLRSPEPDDVDKIVENYRNNPDTESDWLADELHFPRSVDSCRKYWERQVSEPQTAGDVCNLIISGSGGELYGFINAFNTSHRRGGFSYGVSLLPRYRGLGYAAEAVTLLLDYYFNHLRYHRCGIQIYEFNLPSIRFHEKFGFRKCGEFHESHYCGGKYHNSLIYEITADQFNSRTAAVVQI